MKTLIYPSHMYRGWWVWSIQSDCGRVLDGDKAPTERLAEEAVERAWRRLVDGEPTVEVIVDPVTCEAGV